MSLTLSPPEIVDDVRQPQRERASLDRFIQHLQAAFGVDFTIYDGRNGNILSQGADQPAGDTLYRGQLARSIAERKEAVIAADEDCLLLLALPARLEGGRTCVALAAFATRNVAAPAEAAGAAKLLLLRAEDAVEFINRQTCWSADALLRLGSTSLSRFAAEQRAERLESEVENVSQNLANTYEEICLLHSLTQNLRISSTDEDLAATAVASLVECIAAKGAAIQLLPVAEEEEVTYKYKTRTHSVLLTAGDCPLDSEAFTQLINYLQIAPGGSPLVANRQITCDNDWPFPGIQQLIVSPLVEGDNVFGWLAAFNHREELEFGTVEASLLSSVAAILGIHCGNRDLYRQQAEFLADVVRTMTSAIDAKDPYTCGHSDRVARIAVRLAKQLELSSAELNTIYMAGLLHDVGKIGIDDAVLRKPGRLTNGEFEHIKLHPELGHKILADLKQLADVLPAVLHHHEQWDGTGYPHELAGDDIPLIARIVAVADAFDAMTSDRPYRRGMAISNVDEIFRGGAGIQWDEQVIAAYFAAYDDIGAITNRERADLSLDVQQWT